jgi:hypothetical protein
LSDSNVQRTAKNLSMKKLYTLLPIEIKSSDKDKATITAVFSTADEDRHGDIVHQDWDLKSFKKNPVIINSHNYYDATEVIGKATRIEMVDGKLEGDIQFAVDENPKAKIIHQLYDGGFLRSFSVGFIAKQFNDKGEILKSELLEVSAVSVPANTRALAKTKGIDTDVLFKMNDEETSPAPEEVKSKVPAETIEKQPEVEPEVIDEVDDTEQKQAEARQTVLKIASVIDSFCKSVKVETRLKDGIAKEKRAINRAVRNLLKLKS